MSDEMKPAPEVAVPNVDIINNYRVEFRPGTYGQEACITTPWGTPAFRTKQELYRFVAHALRYADRLPDETIPSTLDEVVEAVKQGMH